MGTILACIFLVIVFLDCSIFIYFGKFIHNLSTIKKSKILLILGAGLKKGNLPSDILKDRLISAYIYSEKFIPQIIIVSGTKKSRLYDEPAAMKKFLSVKGINNKNITLDNTGFSTMHSFINIINSRMEGDITIVSQRFHLYRALMISRLLGVNSYGLEAENMQFSKLKMAYWYFREFFAIPYNLIKLSIYFLAK